MSTPETPIVNSAEHHDQPPYKKIWIALLVLLGVSVIFGQIHNIVLMNILVFGVAGVKIVLVTRYFMHVKDEPTLVTVLLVGAFLCLVALFIGTMPDVGLKVGWSGR